MTEIIVEYPLSPKYIPNWTPVEALRELIANALDTKSKVSVKFHKTENQGIISDTFSGIPRSFWVFGEGNHGEIGQFGEGLKLALLVLTRENIAVEVETVGYTVVPSMQESLVFGTKVLVLKFVSNNRSTGTEIRVRCVSEDFLKARNLFLAFNGAKYVSPKLGILEEPGVLYINGVFVQKLEKALWGYDIRTKEAANRDRSILDMDLVKREIGNKLGGITSPSMLSTLLLAISNPKSSLEEEIFPNIPENRRSFWRSTFQDIFGKNACLNSYNDKSNKLAERHGFKLVNLPYSYIWAVKNCGIKHSDYLNFNEAPRMSRLVSSLSSSELENLKFAKAVAEKILPGVEITQIRVVESIASSADSMKEGSTTLGLYFQKRVYLSRSVLKSRGNASSVLLHERLHGLGLQDNTIEFESALTEVIGKVMDMG